MKKHFSRTSKYAFSLFALVFALSLTLGMAYGQADHSQNGLTRAIEAQNMHTEALMAIPGVVGHGVGISSDGEPVITIFVVRAGIPGIPAALEGVPTKVEVTGMIVAYIDTTVRFDRPVPIGVSTGHPDITAGTIGCRVKDGSGNVYALSNNHVYANSNEASTGDYVIQPGAYDGGSLPDDYIGTLHDFEDILFDGSNNTIDAAIAISSDVNCSTPSDGYGKPSSIIHAAYGVPDVIDDPDEDLAKLLGLSVQKYGRTTKLTNGQVSEINATVDVCYETRGPIRCVKLARFVDQIVITPGAFSDGGDSGSLIVTDDSNKNPVGLLFAGSSAHTIANRIDLVLDRFSVTVDDGSGSTGTNNPPTVTITSPTDGASFSSGEMISFAGSASDNEDGDLTASLVWTSDLDGQIGTGGSFSAVLGDGTHTITASVTDSGGSTVSDSVTITVGDGSGGITLTATGYKVRGRQKADLEWSGATSTNVDVYRDGVKIATTKNDGFYTDNIDNLGGGSYTYEVYDAGTDTWSNEATVTF